MRRRLLTLLAASAVAACSTSHAADDHDAASASLTTDAHRVDVGTHRDGRVSGDAADATRRDASVPVDAADATVGSGDGGGVDATDAAPASLFPKMPWSSSGTVYVADVRGDGAHARLTAWALEGLINQTAAESYIVSGPHDMEQLQASGKTIVRLNTDAGENPGLGGLFNQFSDRVKMIWEYDTTNDAGTNDWEFYLAVMEAAQTGGIPVTASLLGQEPFSSNQAWTGLPRRAISDLLPDAGGMTRAQAYAWAQANLIENTSTQVLFVLNQGKPLLDYAVAAKGFIFWLDLGRQDAGDLNEAINIFQDRHYQGVSTNHITSLMGYANYGGYDGDEANAYANPNGIGYVVSDNYANASFWSSFPDKTYTDAQPPTGTPVDAGSGKIYVTLNWSDGDNLSFDQQETYGLWQDASTRKNLAFPVATTLSPALRELNPPLLDWYYGHRTDNDELIAGPSGLQFIYGDDFSDAGLPAWCKLSGEWLAAAGFRSVYFWNFNNTTPRYAECAALESVSGIFQQDGPKHPFYPYLDAGTPVVNSPDTLVPDGATGDGSSDLAYVLEQVPVDRNGPMFVDAVCGVQAFTTYPSEGYASLEAIVAKLNTYRPGTYVFQLPRDFFATLRAYYRLAPEGTGGSP
jgi:hypothetical protein